MDILSGQTCSWHFSHCKDSGLTKVKQQLLLNALHRALILGGLRSRSSKSSFGVKPCSLELSRNSFLPAFGLFSGVLHTSVVLLTEMCERSPDMLAHFRKVGAFCVPYLAFIDWKMIFLKSTCFFSLRIFFWKQAMKLNKGFD